MVARMSPSDLDVLIVGAGLSGIGAAAHLQDRCPGKTYAILEARHDLGGTWDLFRYPGVRSDSDMQTLGYRFRPWTGAKALADGPAILRYVRDTAREHGVDERIRFHHRVVRAEWSTAGAAWTVDVERTDTGESLKLTCGFLYICGGYYRYDEGYTPHFDGTERFAGQIVHPQHWPEDLDYSGKRVVVVGSGATAVTLVPAMASEAEHVTMVQRSPSYILSLPDEDPIAKALGRVLPARVVHPIVRWKNVVLAILVYQASQRLPRQMRRLLRWVVRRHLPADYAVDTHFKPRYDPWDQRLCLVPNGDLFEAISAGDVSMVTDHIETFTERGLELRSGLELDADIVVTATGLNLLAFGGVQLAVDGDDVELPDTMAYKGMMLSGVPNFAYTIGYTNISWTLKADLVAEYVCRLINHMDALGDRQMVPERRDPDVTEQPFLDFEAGYVLRSLDQFPKQGSKAPWRLNQNYPVDLLALRHGEIDDEQLRFSSPSGRAAAAPSPTL
jgi:cation diffusion facilitator CzcD-associated flavoprotein CzcO